MTTHKQIYLAAHPQGMPSAEHLVMREVETPSPKEGEVLVKTVYLSLDPYMRGRMNPGKSYAAAVNLGEVMTGGTVGQVVESRSSQYKKGDWVLCVNGWQEYGCHDEKAVRRLDPEQAPVSTAVGVLGMPGFTAYAGLLEIGQPQPGETVLVSAASGAVGQVVGQIARIKGCRVVGIAGADDKCEHVVSAYGFDACVNYKDEDFFAQLKAACPDGVDVYFENVGGKVFDAAIRLMNDFGRIPVCGRIANYNSTEAPEGPDQLPGFMGRVLVQRLLVKGFIQFDYQHLEQQFYADMAGWIKAGEVRYQEDVVQGLENAVDAFQGLLTGRNRGKLLVQVSADETIA
ncbi:MAG TPA: NADP-dependent oxidoreductase [Alcanivoracaceae bacterium]|nr:NADP-dependent oxidoreductase [Alcanivoracaceae bacterium]